MIKGLHHNAWRCKDSEETRRFYEEFLGLRFAHALRIRESMTGRSTDVLHTFFEMGDGSYLAFFEAPDRPFDFKQQHDYDLHIALEVDAETLERMLAKAKGEGREVRGISDHRFIRSIYLRDPSGYVVELTCKLSNHDGVMQKETDEATRVLSAWQKDKVGQAA